MSLQVVWGIALVINPTIGIQPHTTQQPHSIFCSHIAELFCGVKATVGNSQKPPYDDCVDVVTPAPGEQSCVILYKCCCGAVIFAARSNSMCAREIQAPFGTVIPCPKHPRIDRRLPRPSHRRGSPRSNHPGTP